MQVPASKRVIANAISACEYVNVFGTDRNEKREQSSVGYCVWLSIYLWGGGRHEGRFSDCRHIGLPTKPCRGLNRQSRSSRNASAASGLPSAVPHVLVCSDHIFPGCGHNDLSSPLLSGIVGTPAATSSRA